MPSVHRRQPARCHMRDCAPSPPVAASCALLRVRPSFAPQTNCFPLFDPTCERTQRSRRRKGWLHNAEKQNVKPLETQVAAQGRKAARLEGASRALGGGEKGSVRKSRALTIVNSPWLCSIVKTLVRRVVTQVQVDACCYSTCSFMSRLLPDGNRIDCDKSLVVRPTSC